jgi:purine nucleosidase
MTRRPEEQIMQRIIIDCDPGQDDAIALMLAALSSDELEILAVTTVAGNVPEPDANDNARRVLSWIGARGIPIHHGSAQPLTRPARRYFPDGDGLRGTNLPAPILDAAAEPAVAAICRTVAEQPPGSVTLCVLGPMTNIAHALQVAPDLAARLGGIAFMGGAIGTGNVTPSAEFNIHSDPEAAAIVLAAGTPLTMFGLEVCHQATADDRFVETLASLDTPAAQLTATLLGNYGNATDAAHYAATGRPLYDVCVVAWLLRPDLFRGADHHVHVETSDEQTLGRTIVDTEHGTGHPSNVHVMTEVDAHGFLQFLHERLHRTIGVHP